MEQRTPEWFAARSGRITGSSVGAILGLSSFATSEDVMRRMVREYHGQPSEFTGNAATDYGTINEPNALEDYKLETGNDVKDEGFVLYSDWLGASPDGLIGDDGLIEIKCPYSKRNDLNPVFLPAIEQMHYYAQMQIQMLCTGREWCDFYQWNCYGSKLERINYNPQWIETYLPELELFYQVYLTARESENAWRYLDGGQLVKDYKEKLAALEVAKSEVADAKQCLIDATNGEGGKIGDLTISKVSKKGAISYSKAIKDIAPDADLELYRGKDSEYWVVK